MGTCRGRWQEGVSRLRPHPCSWPLTCGAGGAGQKVGARFLRLVGLLGQRLQPPYLFLSQLPSHP